MAFSGGCLIFFVGVRHFPLAYQMVHHQEFAHLSSKASDIFILLWFCIGLLLMNFGILAIYFSRKLKQGDQAARFFFLCTGIVLIIRTVFESKYPVAIPSANPFVMIRLVTMALLFLVPFFITISDETE